MAGTIKLDGAQFLEKVNNEFKITNSELKLKSSGNTVVDSSGNAVLSESGGAVTLGNVRLPATGGISNSSGSSVLSESGGTVTFGNASVASTLDTTNLALSANNAGVKTALNASGDAPIYACRAWVNFNGTGTVAIRASSNVSSITDNGSSSYVVNFTTAMSDDSYSGIFCGSNRSQPGVSYGSYETVDSQTSSGFAFAFKIHTTGGGCSSEPSIVNAAVFR